MRLFLSRMKRGLTILLCYFSPCRSGRNESITKVASSVRCPPITNTVLFNTTNADAVLAAMQIFPPTNPWNGTSRNGPCCRTPAMIARRSCGLGRITAADVTRVQGNEFVLVPDNQPTLPINFVDYPDESDLDGGTFPQRALSHSDEHAD